MVIITNAAGGLDPNNNVGDIVCVDDHFALPNMAGKNGLVGKNDPELGPRFPPMSNAYDPELSALVVKAGENEKQTPARGRLERRCRKLPILSNHISPSLFPS